MNDMHAWQAVQRTLDFIESHLAEDLPIDRLAGIAALSPFYFQRLFSRLVNRPVNEYVKLRRLAHASEDLKKDKKRILDIALDYGFSDHAAFTRAFKDAYGVTPEAYRSHPVMLNHFIKPDLALKYAAIAEHTPLIADGLVIEIWRRTLENPRTFLGLVGEAPEGELAGGQATGVATMGELWDAFHHLAPDTPGILPKRNEIGVLYQGEAREGCCSYFTGVESSAGAVAEGTCSFTLPCGDYAVCGFEAESFTCLIDTAVKQAVGFMERWLKEQDLACGGFIAEMYPRDDRDANYMELWLPVRPLVGLPRAKKASAWDKTDETRIPSIETISADVNSPLWGRLCETIELFYRSKPLLEYSRCSMQFGWNVKYKKAGRSLCTLYPMEGYFIALIVIGSRERDEFELALPSFSPYTQELYRETRQGMDQKWLMFHVTDDAVLEDVIRCVEIRDRESRRRRG
jgi:AraC family transcriptional regulator